MSTSGVKLSPKTWVSEPHEALEPHLGTEGLAALPPQTVIEVFKATVEKFGDRPALSFKIPKEDGTVNGVTWTTWSWKEYYAQSIQFAKALVSQGFAPHCCTNILGFNSKEWFVANCGTIAAGGIAAGIYATNNSEACHYITEHSEAEVVVLDGMKQLEKYKDTAKSLKHLKALVVYGEKLPADLSEYGKPVYIFEDFLKLGDSVEDRTIDARISDQKPGHCATLIYTSGTTGPPKAVMISHDNITWTVQAALAGFDFDETERCISFLPLSHIAAQVLDIHGPMGMGAHVFFAQPDALRGSLGSTLKEVQPTMFFGVPRVWEKIYEKMQAIGKANSGLKLRIATWAKRKGLENAHMQEYGGGKGHPCGYGTASAIIFSKVKAALGLQHCKACFTAAAPISEEILSYFASIDIPIYEVFGQSECTGPHTVNTIDAWKIGTCGRPMQGTESKLVPETGELCYRGRHIFMGYMHDPKNTAETIDDEGWMHSGDVATFDDDIIEGMKGPSGFMRITGRIKELIITAGGENIPPVIIEDEFKRQMPCVSNCMVIGDKKKFLSILISLKTDMDPETGLPLNTLTGDALENSQRIGSESKTVEEAAKCEKWKSYIDGGMKLANAKTTSRAQVVQKWVLLPEDFSEKGGELTPTLKLKRKPTAEKYKDLIDSMYAESG